jgi:hypothetical protein
VEELKIEELKLKYYLCNNKKSSSYTLEFFIY